MNNSTKGTEEKFLDCIDNEAIGKEKDIKPFNEIIDSLKNRK
jgi:hypothetical protein